MIITDVILLYCKKVNLQFNDNYSRFSNKSICIQVINESINQILSLMTKLILVSLFDKLFKQIRQ